MLSDRVIEGILSVEGDFRQTNGSSFADWLATHDREVAAKAWGEGLQVAYNHVGRLEDADAAGQGVTIPDPVNPYRAALGVPVGTEKEGGES